MKRVATLFGALALVGASFTMLSGASGATGAAGGSATPPKNPLTITGSAVAGIAYSGGGANMVYDFTIKNHGKTDVDTSFWYQPINATAVQYLCPKVGTHVAISPDTPACEPGLLGPRQSTQSAIIVAPVDATQPSGVSVCALDLSDIHEASHCATVVTPVS